MTKRIAMNDEERRQLLEELALLASDADQDAARIETVFLPLPSHGRALRPDILVVRGERGAGKTALFHFLRFAQQQPETWRAVGVDQGKTTWVEGFSEVGQDHPTAEMVEGLPESDLRQFWAIHLACTLAEHPTLATESPQTKVRAAWKSHRNDIQAWLSIGRGELPDLTRWLDELDKALEGSDRHLVVTYDHLDKIGLANPGARRAAAAQLLALWLSLANRYRRIRAKVFLREDLFDECQDAFADASKLATRSVSLAWDRESLYRVLLRHMAARPPLADWVQRGSRAITLTNDPVLGPVPPALSARDQRRFVTHLAGEQMGRGIKKGYTDNWIVNRLQDAHVRVVPRSLLTLVGESARVSLRSGPAARGDRLLHSQTLAAALEETSKRRVRELAEEHPVVRRLEALRGKQVMLERAEAEDALGAGERSSGDAFGHDGAAIADELLRIGVLNRRSDGRIDIPDIYRYGFGIKRKGGVARPR